MGAIDSYTKLLLHCNGADTSTTFIDSSIYNHTMTAYNGAQIDTAQYKFGGASALFAGDDDYISTPHDSEWDLTASADWTIDFWMRVPNVGAQYDNIINRAENSVPYNGWDIRFDNISRCGISNTAVGSLLSASGPIEINTWYHIAVVHDDTNDKLMVFQNGVKYGNETASTAINWTNTNEPLNLGYQPGFGRYYDGWLDEVRISKGIARWTENFTPPTREYGTSAKKPIVII